MRYKDPAAGLALERPADWYEQPFKSGCLGGLQGALVTNLDHTFEEGSATDHCPLAWDMRGLPENLVVIEVRTAVQVPPNLGDPDTPMPLDLADAQMADNIQYPSGQFAAPEPRLLLVATVDGRSYTLSTWFGPAVTRIERGEAERVFASLTFEGRPSIRDNLPTCSFEIGDTIRRDGMGAIVPGLGEGVTGHFDGVTSSGSITISTSPSGVVYVAPPGEYCLLAAFAE